MKRSIITTDIKAEVLGSNADSSSSRLGMESAEIKLVPVNVIDFGSKRKLEVDPESHAVDPFGTGTVIRPSWKARKLQVRRPSKVCAP